MINIKKINVEFILSIIFTLLLILVALQDTKVIWSHFNFISSLWSFEIDSTWGRQMVLTQNIVLVSMGLLVLFIVVMRIRQIRKNR